MSAHAKKAVEFQRNAADAEGHDRAVYAVRAKRDAAARAIADDWENLRTLASDIKRHTITHLDVYAEKFAANAEKNGIHTHWARDAADFNAIVLEILRRHAVRKLVKSKSMLTEECGMNTFLAENGIEVVETDLGERIIQLMGLAPSHIVMPAIHIKRERVGRLFEEKLGSEKGNHDPTYLTRQARIHLRHAFLEADAGLTGANFAVADHGGVVVCTNEGNADMSASCPKLHIACVGLEKIVPDLASLGVFTRLLARSGTGQPTTVYTSHFFHPRPDGELHIVIVDNGRSEILANRTHWETLKCLRCGACMNTCPVYRRSGGYSYSGTIPGPIGINLGMLRDPHANAGNVSACTLCASCDNVCPAKVDLSTQIYRWRQDLATLGVADPMKRLMSSGMHFLFTHPALYVAAQRLSPLLNALPRPLVYNRLNAWGRGHELPRFPKKSFARLLNEGIV